MTARKLGSLLVLAAFLASMVPSAAPACGASPAQDKAKSARTLQSVDQASAEKLLALEANSPNLLRQRAGNEAGIQHWFTLLLWGGIAAGAYYAYEANRFYIADTINAASNKVNNVGGGGNNNNNNNN